MKLQKLPIPQVQLDIRTRTCYKLYIDNKLDRGADPISSRQLLSREAEDLPPIRLSRCCYVKGRSAEEASAYPCKDGVPGLQQNMLQTVTPVERYHGIRRRVEPPYPMP